MVEDYSTRSRLRWFTNILISQESLWLYLRVGSVRIKT